MDKSTKLEPQEITSSNETFKKMTKIGCSKSGVRSRTSFFVGLKKQKVQQDLSLMIADCIAIAGCFTVRFTGSTEETYLGGGKLKVQ